MTESPSKLPQIKEKQIIPQTPDNQSVSQRSEAQNSRMQRSVSQQDSFHQLDQIRLLEAREQRKKIEVETKQLQSRINKLQNEELLMERKIDGTTKKAYDIYSRKREIQQKKIDEKIRIIKEVDKVPFTFPKAQLDNLRIQLAKDDLLKARKQGVEQVKYRMQTENSRKTKEESARMENIKFKVDIIQQHHKSAQMRMTIEKELKLQKIRQDQKSKKEVEVDKIRKEKEKMRLLETFEMDLVDRIKNTAIRHKIATEQLEFARNQEAKEFEKRFGIERVNDSHNNSVQGPSNNKKNVVTYGLYINSRGQIASGRNKGIQI